MDWNRIKSDYVNSDISIRALAKKYGISYSTLQGRARRENWNLLRQAGETVSTELRESLDVLARRDLWKIVESLRGQTTVLLTTHYMEEAQALADRIAVMQKGKIAAMGTLDELREQSGTDSTASLEDIFVRIMEGGSV